MSVNNVVIQGKVISKPEVQFTYGIEKILEVKIEYKRISGKIDTFMVNFSHSLQSKFDVGDYIEIEGSIRSASVAVEGCEYKKLKVYIFGSKITKLDEEPEVYKNQVELKDVELLKDPVLRKSYADDSIDICDLKLRAFRNINKYSIIFCTCWNSNARLMAKYKKGVHLDLEGRLQSYCSTMTNYLKMEVSVNSLNIKEDKVTEKDNAVEESTKDTEVDENTTEEVKVEKEVKEDNVNAEV